MAETIEWLISGLGNPGSKYAGNRHNIGWMVAAEFCSKHKIDISRGSNIYYFGTANINSHKILVAFPTTYMNNSGEAVRKISDKYQIPSERIIIIVDEYNFPLGKVHIKDNGSDGGHNGVKSIIEELDTTNFYRLRCGIGKNFEPGAMVDYVLSDFKKDEIHEVELMVKKAVEAIEHLIRVSPPNRAVSEINSGKMWE